MRLRTIEQRFGDRVLIERRSFALRPSPDPTAQFRGTRREATWRRIAAMVKPDGINWKLWERDDYPNWSLPALEAASAAGLRTATLSPAYGGAGIDSLTTARVVEELGRADLGVSVVIAQTLKIAQTLQQAASPEQRDRFVPKFANTILSPSAVKAF